MAHHEKKQFDSVPGMSRDATRRSRRTTRRVPAAESGPRGLLAWRHWPLFTWTPSPPPLTFTTTEGWLQYQENKANRGVAKKGWKKRWCRLDRNVLSLFKCVKMCSLCPHPALMHCPPPPPTPPLHRDNNNTSGEPQVSINLARVESISVDRKLALGIESLLAMKVSLSRPKNASNTSLMIPKLPSSATNSTTFMPKTATRCRPGSTPCRRPRDPLIAAAP